MGWFFEILTTDITDSHRYKDRLIRNLYGRVPDWGGERAVARSPPQSGVPRQYFPETLKTGIEQSDGSILQYGSRPGGLDGETPGRAHLPKPW